MLAEFDLSGEVAVVTGGNGGIGRGIALGLARAGADVVIAARNPDKTDAVVAEVGALGRRAAGFTCDITRRADLDRVVEQTVAKLGKLSLFVNNAAVYPRPRNPARYPEDEWDAVMDTNLKGTLRGCQAAYPALVANGGESIINIASVGALVTVELQLAYATSKTGVLYLTRTLAVAWGKDHVRVNALLPGVVHTDMTPGLADPAVRAQFEKIPAGRLAHADEFGGAAVFLASPAAAMMTGQSLVLDGGLAIMPPG